MSGVDWRQDVMALPWSTVVSYLAGIAGCRVEVEPTMFGTWMAEIEHGHHVRVTRTDFDGLESAMAWAERIAPMVAEMAKGGGDEGE